MDDITIYYFLDNSNIYTSLQTVAERLEGPEARSKIRLNFSALKDLAVNNRPHGGGDAVVSRNDYDTQQQ